MEICTGKWLYLLNNPSSIFLLPNENLLGVYLGTIILTTGLQLMKQLKYHQENHFWPKAKVAGFWNTGFKAPYLCKVSQICLNLSLNYK